MIFQLLIVDQLQYPPYSFLAIRLEYLVEVVGYVVGGDGAVTHDEVVGFLFGDGSDDGFVDVAVEAGDEVAVVYYKYLLAVYLTLLNLA